MASRLIFHVELKVDGAWQHYASPHMHGVAARGTLFYALGSSRGREPGDPRFDRIRPGLPDDLSAITEISRDVHGTDVRDQGHIVGEDVVLWARYWEKHGWAFEKRPNTPPNAVNWEHGLLRTYLPGGDDFYDFYRYPEERRSSRIEDIRYVFWFVN